MTEVAAAIALLAIPNYTLRDNHLDVAMVIRWLLACGYVVEKVLESRVHGTECSEESSRLCKLLQWYLLLGLLDLVHLLWLLPYLEYIANIATCNYLGKVKKNRLIRFKGDIHDGSIRPNGIPRVK